MHHTRLHQKQKQRQEEEEEEKIDPILPKSQECQ